MDAGELVEFLSMYYNDNDGNDQAQLTLSLEDLSLVKCVQIRDWLALYMPGSTALQLARIVVKRRSNLGKGER